MSNAHNQAAVFISSQPEAEGAAVSECQTRPAAPDLEQMTRAFLCLIQEDNGCNRMQERAGVPCNKDTRHCGCWLEMMERYEDAE
jgi:hypothetical protein